VPAARELAVGNLGKSVVMMGLLRREMDSMCQAQMLTYGKTTGTDQGSQMLAGNARNEHYTSEGRLRGSGGSTQTKSRG